ncbi:SGNH/GDSL hydrolase family protein [Dactylosporangium sp. NPDC049140]|uniref:SGNH/GDSL hydrolase family protein n=1 Tax=Dactylosporangium sp. NPDC049140 TaxID=3155647 RepID=UPI0033DBB869
MRFRQKTAIAGAVIVASTVLTASAAGAAPPGSDTRWSGVWAASMIAAAPPPFGQGPANWSMDGFADQSVRQVVRVSRGGSDVRIRLSNVYGTTPLLLAGASIGLAGDGATVRPETMRALTFDRSRSTVVPPGGEAASDAVRMRVAPLQRLSVTLYFARPTGPATFHLRSFATSYKAAGDHRRDEGAAAFAETTTSWYYLTGVDVAGATDRNGGGAVVAFGDSITDGAVSTTDADHRYPDELADRLVAAGRPIGVLNAGIATNQVLGTFPGGGASALDRFRRDALEQPGVRCVILLEGINDIAISTLTTGEPVSAAALIDGYRTLIDAAHRRGIRVVGATLMPTKGAAIPAYYTERGEAVRTAVNEWIRGGGGFDAVVDLDHVFADPADPDRMRAEFDSGDGVHPNDAGMRAIAGAIATSPGFIRAATGPRP